MLSFFFKPWLHFLDQQGQNQKVRLRPNESVLSALLRSGHTIPFSCKAGLCQSCKVQCVQPSKLPAGSQRGLKNAHAQQGFFLACLCFPKRSLDIKLPDANDDIGVAKVVGKEFLNEKVIRLRLSTDIEFNPGQFCNLFKSTNVVRSYSIANTPADDYLEFHIKYIENGKFSAWVANDLRIGDELNIQGAYGNCIYTETNKNKPLLLCGISTGLAPLAGIVKHALETQHTGTMDLVIGARKAKDFYLTGELFSLADKHKNLKLHWLCSEEHPKNIYFNHADLYQYVSEHFADLSEYSVFLCGAPTFVTKLKKQCFLSNASMGAIHSDAFTSAK